MSCYVFVEGHGEVEAAGNLLARVADDRGLPIVFRPATRWKNLHKWDAPKGGVRAAAEFARSRRASAALILRDADDECPKELAPEVGRRLRELDLPFPVAYVLLHPEYEVLFLPGLTRIGLPAWDRDSWEARRGIKEWISGHLPRGTSYKPTVDQLPYTRSIDIAELRDADVPCFGSLERAIGGLAHAVASQERFCYPPA